MIFSQGREISHLLISPAEKQIDSHLTRSH